MTERKIDQFFEQFVGSYVEIVLSNQMHYNGKVLSYGNEYLKIVDKYSKIVFIVKDKICSINIREEM